MFRKLFSERTLPLLCLVLLGCIVTTIVSLQTVNVGEVDIEDASLSLDEEAYYEYVAPRLEVLVAEVDSTVEMVETKSRDIIKLTRAGSTIETLTGEIRAYGEEHGVPERFQDVHNRILSASDTVNTTFDQARTALRTFQFSGMTDLVSSFNSAAIEFTACKRDLNALVEE